MRKILLPLLPALFPLPLFAATFFVEVGGSAGLVYSPQTLHIGVNDTVVWTNKGGNHNVQADDGSFVCSQGCKGDGSGSTGGPSTANWVTSHKFTAAGTVGYFCILHGAPGTDMFGTIIVGTSPVRLLSFDVD